MTKRFVIEPEAETQILEHGLWWLQNRENALLFEAKLQHALALIVEVTRSRGDVDFAECMRDLVHIHDPNASRIRIPRPRTLRGAARGCTRAKAQGHFRTGSLRKPS